MVRLQLHSPGPVLVLLAALSAPAFIVHAQAQDAGNSLPDAPTPQLEASGSPVTVRGTPRRLLDDQKAIWTSPAHLNDSNALGPAALVLATTLVITTDHQVMSSSRLQNPSLNDKASTASNGLVGGFVAAPVAIFAIGSMHHDDHATETGILGGEAMVDSIAVSEVIKLISMRERRCRWCEGKILSNQRRDRFIVSFKPRHHRLVIGCRDRV